MWEIRLEGASPESPRMGHTFIYLEAGLRIRIWKFFDDIYSDQYFFLVELEPTLNMKLLQNKQFSPKVRIVTKSGFRSQLHYWYINDHS